MYLLIGKSRDNYLSGSYLTYKRLSDHFPDNLHFIDGAEHPEFDISESLRQYSKIVLCCNNHKIYPFKIKNADLMQKNVMLFTRIREIAGVTNSIIGGFSVYRDWKCHKHFVPTIVSSFDAYNDPDEKTFGFYYRPQLAHDAFMRFLDAVRNLNQHVNVVFCGRQPDFLYVKSLCPNIQSIYHTINIADFFSRISHYVVAMDNAFIDPMPHLLVESVQAGKQITVIGCERDFEDGINDIMSVINYHTSLQDDSYLDNANNVLRFESFRNFFSNVIANKFSYHVDYDKYKNFYEWCAHEL